MIDLTIRLPGSLTALTVALAQVLGMLAALIAALAQVLGMLTALIAALKIFWRKLIKLMQSLYG